MRRCGANVGLFVHSWLCCMLIPDSVFAASALSFKLWRCGFISLGEVRPLPVFIILPVQNTHTIKSQIIEQMCGITSLLGGVALKTLFQLFN